MTTDLFHNVHKGIRHALFEQRPSALHRQHGGILSGRFVGLLGKGPGFFGKCLGSFRFLSLGFGLLPGALGLDLGGLCLAAATIGVAASRGFRAMERILVEAGAHD